MLASSLVANLLRLPVAGVVLAALLLALPPAASAVPVVVRSRDGVSTGFNDPTPVAAVGRNPKTTLGAQRLYVYQYAADLWSIRLKGNVPVVVNAGFSDLGGTATGATLGNARPTTVHSAFVGAPVSTLWYMSAPANQLSGTDQNDLLPGGCQASDQIDNHCPEIYSTFNASVDNQTVLGATDFYYGVDGNAGGDIDFLSVVMHELGHGLGFIGTANSDGSKLGGQDDAYVANLEDPNLSPKKFLSMTQNQRAIALKDPGALVLVGPEVVKASGGLVSGRRADGAVQVYAPSTYQSGSSQSHYDTALSPNELMEPNLTFPAPHDMELTLALMRDVGWQTAAKPLCGDATLDGKLTAADALKALKSSVGTGTCSPVVCDVTSPGGVTASDALRILKKAVGQLVDMNCPVS